jgi:DNA-directed RNA polymerase subunit RPC12/RpoP
MFTATPKHVVEAMARESVDILATDPELAYFTAMQLLSRIPTLTMPALTVITETDEDDEPITLLACPYCNAHRSDVRVVDTGVRWTTDDEIDGDNLTVTFDYQNGAQFDTLSYACVGCDRPVSLPEGWAEV